MSSWRRWYSVSSSSRSANSSTVSISITWNRYASTPALRTVNSMEFFLLLASPLTGAAVLATLGARRSAPEINIAFSLATFLAACVLTVHVVSAGTLTFAHDQFFIDAFNVFLVTLTALVGLTTAIF